MDVSINPQTRMVSLSGQCKMCQTKKIITIPEDKFRAWQKGGHIQRVFPQLSADDREFMMSEICGPCFDKVFG